eukprot:COSAG05_NODE_305_length_11703_cov_15.056705_8_plen_472_part_00
MRRRNETWRRAVAEHVELIVAAEPARARQESARLRRSIALRGCPDQVHLRRRVWLLLLGLDPTALDADADWFSAEGREAAAAAAGEAAAAEGATAEADGPDKHQLWLDVERSLNHFELSVYGRPTTRGQCRLQLFQMMWRVLSRHHSPPPSSAVPLPDQPQSRRLHYYQGYHDVSSVLLLLGGERMGAAMLERISLAPLRFALAPTMAPTSEVLQLLYPLLRLTHPAAARLLQDEAEIAEPIFALSWVLTWFAHDLHDLGQVARVFDLFIAIGHPLTPLYFSAALVEHRMPELLALHDPDFARCHHLLREVPQGKALPLAQLARRTVELMEDRETWPPRLLGLAEVPMPLVTDVWPLFIPATAAKACSSNDGGGSKQSHGSVFAAWGGLEDSRTWRQKPAGNTPAGNVHGGRLGFVGRLAGAGWRQQLVRVGGAALSTGLSMAGGALLMATEAEGGVDIGLEGLIRGMIGS